MREAVIQNRRSDEDVLSHALRTIGRMFGWSLRLAVKISIGAVIILIAISLYNEYVNRTNPQITDTIVTTTVEIPPEDVFQHLAHSNNVALRDEAAFRLLPSRSHEEWENYEAQLFAK